MGTAIHYHADASRDQQIDRLCQAFDRPEYGPMILDFPFSPKWVNTGYLLQPDHEENWTRYAVATLADALKHKCEDQTPDHFRGVILDVDPGCQHLRFVFGRYPDKLWHCDGFLKTQYAEHGFSTHVEVVEFLRELEPIVD